MSALQIRAQWAGKWSIGSTAWNRNGQIAALRRNEGETDGEHHVFEVQVYLNDLDPNAVRVELYADGINGGAPVRQEMKRASANWRGSRGRLCVQRGCFRVRAPSELYGARDAAAATALRSHWKTHESCGSDD